MQVKVTDGERIVISILLGYFNKPEQGIRDLTGARMLLKVKEQFELRSLPEIFETPDSGDVIGSFEIELDVLDWVNDNIDNRLKGGHLPASHIEYVVSLKDKVKDIIDTEKENKDEAPEKEDPKDEVSE